MPRTQTNDQNSSHARDIITFWNLNNISNGQELWSNTRADCNAIITCIDICCSVASTATCAIGLNQSGYPFFGAQTGAGQWDTFSWRGELMVPGTGGIYVVQASASAWSCMGSGYYAPSYLTG